MICRECGFENENKAAFCAGCGAALQKEVERLGPYELRGELGRGAMARVWRAWDPNLGREVAIKEPLFDLRLGQAVLDEMSRRFVREAKTAARLNHPGVVTIYAADVYDGRPAIVMELVEGVTLADMLERGRMSTANALDVMDQLLDAVGYAHENGVVHRDIKPDNIFVSKDGRVKLADFGIARVESGMGTTSTVAGTVLGTPGYMSPEQVKGTIVDSRSDLFSIGVVGYEMLSGSNPFGAGGDTDMTTLLYRIVHEPVPELPEAVAAGLPADVRPAIMAALAKHPEDRPQTAAAFKAMLHGEVQAPTARLATPQEAPASLQAAVRDTQQEKKNWMPYVVVAVACLAVIGAVLFFALSGSQGSVSPVGGNAGTATSASSSASGSAASQNSSSTPASQAYLAVKDGMVAIYTNSSATPFEVTDVRVSDLGSDEQAAIDKHIACATVEEAQAKVDDMRQAIETAKKEAEEKARQEAEEKARQEEEERQRAEAEAQAQAERERQERIATAEAAQRAAERAAGGKAFWGVWIGAFKNLDNAQNYVAQAQNQGFSAQMYESTDWENLNSDHYYVVSLGEYGSEEEARSVLPDAQEAGYDDAYVKYTGNRK